MALCGIGIAVTGCLGDDETDQPNGTPARIHTFMRNARGFDGTIIDHRDESEVQVEVGAGDQGLAFAPAAIRVDAGTTVVWEWTGHGGRHDVASIGGSDFSFASDITRDEGHTYTETFDTSGVALYECRPHRAQQMLGAIDVVFPEDDVMA